MFAVDLDDTHYDILGINRKASDEDVKAAYRRLSKVNHPDLGGDVDTFAAINVAFETLRDHRADYDQALAAAVKQAADPERVAVDDEWEPEAWDEEIVENDPQPFDNDMPVSVPVPKPAVRPEPTYTAATSVTLAGKVGRIVAGVLLVVAGLAALNYMPGRAGVPWVSYVSVAVCVIAFWRGVGLTLPVLFGELIVSALIIWGAYAGAGWAGALAAIGGLAPIVAAGEVFCSLSRTRKV